MKEIASALNKLQSEIEGVKKTKNNPGFRGAKYADLQAVWDSVREPLTRNGLSVVQLPSYAEPGFISLRTIILHVSGESIEDAFQMPLKDPSNPQAAGSALTYARRYALMAALGLAPEDDDGNAAAATEKPKADPSVLLMKFNVAEQNAELETMKAVYVQLKGLVTPNELGDLASRIRKVKDNG